MSYPKTCLCLFLCSCCAILSIHSKEKPIARISTTDSKLDTLFPAIAIHQCTSKDTVTKESSLPVTSIKQNAKGFYEILGVKLTKQQLNRLTTKSGTLETVRFKSSILVGGSWSPDVWTFWEGVSKEAVCEGIVVPNTAKKTVIVTCKSWSEKNNSDGKEHTINQMLLPCTDELISEIKTLEAKGVYTQRLGERFFPQGEPSPF